MAINKALRQAWVDAGYDPNMGSAIVVPPPPRDFLRLYYMTSAEFGISNIALGRIKVSRFSDLNDPFELMAIKSEDVQISETTSKFKDEYDEHAGLLCFSANWTSPVLWSHYGSRHRGICLGVDLKRTIAQKVCYEDERILTHREEIRGQLDEKLKYILLRTKFVHWIYEEEYRMFVKLDDVLREGRLHFYEFSDNLRLTEVILGPQCSLSLDAVRQLTRTQHPQAVVFKARLAWNSFADVPDECTVP
jgi:hypothetical protein